MAAPWNPPKKGEDFQTSIGLEDMANAGSFKAAPTIELGDFQISKDKGLYANLTTLPTNEPAGSTDVVLAVSATEMNADSVTITGIDQTVPKEWADFKITIPTT